MPWIFGYGSLVGDGAVACSLRGHRRHWGVAMDNRVDLPGYKHFVDGDGGRPAVHVCFLDLRPDPGGTVNGAAIRVADEALPGLDGRERNYDRVEITGQLDAELGGRVYTYVGSADGRRRLREGLAAGTARISREYADRVRAGFRALGQEQAYLDSTDPDPCELADLRVIHHPPAS